MKFILSLLMLLAGLACSAQRVRILTPDDHLSNSLINQIYQDSEGYIWIATENGLNRYDGINISVYNADDGHSGLDSKYIHCLYEDSRGRLLVGCIGGLFIYSRQTDTFTPVPMIVRGDTCSAHVTGLAEDQYGNVWISTSGRGLLKLDEKNAVESTPLPELSGVDFISSVIVDRRNRLWVVAPKNGVICYDLKSVRAYNIPIENNRILAENAFIAESGNNILLTVYDDCLHVYDREGDCFRACGFVHPDDRRAMTVSAIATIDGQTLVGTDGNGLFAFDPQAQRRERVELPQVPNDMERAKIHSLMQDRDGNSWLGLFQKGIVMVSHTSGRIRHYAHRVRGRYSIGAGCVMCAYAAPDGLWAAVDGDGLWFVDNEGASTHYADHLPATIMDLTPSLRGGLWLASYTDGLKRFTPPAKIEDFNDKLRRAFAGFNGRTTTLARDADGDLWVGTYGCGVLRLMESGQCDAFVSTSENMDYSRNEPTNNWINCLMADGRYVWMGTYRGVSLYDSERELFVRPDSALIATLLPRVVYDIARSTDGRLWFATDNGLVVFDRADGRCRQFNTDNGLANNVVASLVPDNINRMWAGTFGGLSCVSADGRVDNYYTHNGLQDNEYARCCATTDAQGRIYMGGINGISAFDPAQMKPEVQQPMLALTHFFLNGDEVSPDDLATDADMGAGTSMPLASVNDAQSIRFSCAEKSFALEFSTFNFVCPQQVAYNFRLRGYDDTWHSTPEGSPRISFTNIPHGTYMLEVQARVGRTLSAVRTFRIRIEPMWWQTPWAFAIYLLIALIVANGVTMSVRSRMKIRAQLKEHQHERDIDEAKFQFFFNISHEIRTPLTLIINPIRELMADKEASAEAQKSYSLIYRNAARILRLINQMLDMRKIEKGQMTMHFGRVALGQFVEQIEQSFGHTANKKGIVSTITVEVADVKDADSAADSAADKATDSAAGGCADDAAVDGRQPDVYADIDANNFDKVVYNLYSNAFKFTPDGGRIECRIRAEGDSVRIEMADTGPGIGDNHAEKIFNRFYQIEGTASADYVGTGIGLNLTRSIVELHGGTITAGNRPDGTGALFVIVIPRHHTGAVQTQALVVAGSDTDDAAENAANTAANIVADTGANEAADVLDDMTDDEIIGTAELVAPMTEEEKTRSRTNKRLLVVDDEPEVNSYLSAKLQRLYKVTTCNNGRDAYTLLMKKRFDMVISDIMMPEMDGYTLCHKIKTNPNIAHTPVILLTAKHSDEDRGEGFHQGADAYIAKPFDLDILRKTIASIISNRERVLHHAATSATQAAAPLSDIPLENPQDLLLQRVTEFIDKNIDDPNLTADALAVHIGLSRAQLFRRIKDQTGLSVRDYIKTIRMRQAAKLLGEPGHNVAAVAYAVGYNNTSYFSTIFRDFFGVAPKDYCGAGTAEGAAEKAEA